MAGGPVEVTHRWAASVGFTADGRPLCTQVDDGVVAVGGYNGTGNLVGPVAARAAVALRPRRHRAAAVPRVLSAPPPAVEWAPNRRTGVTSGTNGARDRRRPPSSPPRCAAPGCAEVDDSTRRRAEYSTDASNYRVVPDGRRLPARTSTRSPAARRASPASSACRSPRAAAAPRPPATRSAPGIVLDFSRHLNRVLDVDPEARTAVVEPGAILDSITAAAAPHGLRFGPDPSTHARATIGGSIGNNACGSRALTLRPHRRQRRRPRRAHRRRRALHRPPHGRDGLPTAAGPRCSRARRAWSRATWPLIRTEFGRFAPAGVGLLPRAPAARERRRRRQVPGRHRGHARPSSLGATVRLVESPDGRRAGRARLPGHAGRRRRRAGAAAAPPGRARGHGRPAGRRRAHAAAAPAAVPDLPRGEGWLFVETAGDTEAEAAGRGREARRRRRLPGLRRRHRRHRPGRCGASARTAPGSAAAPRPARRPGRAGRTPPSRPSSSGAYLREFDALMREHGLDGLAYGHFGDGCVHVRIDFPFVRRPGALPRRSSSTRPQLVGRHGGSMSGEHGDGRARGELLPYMYSPEAHRAVRRRSRRIFDPAQPAQPRRDRRPGAGRRRPAGARRPAAAHAASRFAYPHDGGDLSTAVHRCVGVGKCRADTTAAGGVMCPSYLATRDEKDSTRGRARVLQELANGTLVERLRAAGAGRVARPVPVVQGLLVGLPGRRRHGHLQGRGAAPALPPPAAPAVALRARAGCRAGPGWPRARPRLANAALRSRDAGRGWPSAPAASTRAGRCRAFAAQTFRAWFAGRPGAHRRPPVLLWVDTFTDHFSPEVGQAAVRVLEAAGYAVQITDEPVCCGLTWISTGQLDGARKQLRRTLDALEHGRARRHPDRRARAVVHRRAAPRPRSSCCPTTRAPARVAAATRTLAELLTGDRRAGRRRRSPACRPSPSRTATSTPSWAGRPTPRCWPRAGADGRGGRRLLRAGRQLRRRARPLRRVGGGGRDRAAAGRARGAATTRWCWPTASPAAPSSSSWPGARGVHLAQLLDDHLPRPGPSATGDR